MRLVQRLKRLEKKHKSRLRAQVIVLRPGDPEPILEPGDRLICVKRLSASAPWDEI